VAFGGIEDSVKTIRPRRRWLRWFAGVCLAACFLSVVFPYLLPKGPRWYVLNPTYALWRYGWHSYDKKAVYEGLNGDIWRNDVVRGKTLPELRAMFSDLRGISELDVYDLAKVSVHTNATRTFVKWADTSWFIEITNGSATAIHLWKG
jgi:hypothetical protein